MFAAAVNLTWDRGVSTGWDLRDEVWTLGIGGSAKDKIGGEFRGGIGFSYLAPGKETNYAPGLNQETDSGYAIIVNASYTLHW
jgi:long-chain fatty acid transport protein